MKAKNTRATALVIALPKSSKTENSSEGENMKNKNISIDGYRKIHRAQNVSFNMNLLIRKQDFNAAPLLWIPDIFSYINEDISDIKEEMKSLGLFDAWLQQEREQIEREELLQQEREKQEKE